MQNQVKDKTGSMPKDIVCYHCGDFCREDHVVHEDKDFCCNGCKTVYEILKENDLCNYYDLQQNPGIALKSKDFGDKYNFLDNKEIEDQILDFREGQTAKVTFYIPSIHCSSCIWLLENLYKLKEGIRYSRVHFSKKEINIDYDPEKINLKELVATLATIGYEPFISLEQESRKKQKTINRDLLLKMGVAGFSFGNIMLLSFPEYFGFEGIDDLSIQRFISWLNVALALPVVFYCSTDYFKSAFTGLKQRYVNIDVPISLGILTLFIVSLVQVGLKQGPGYLDSLSGLLFFLLIGRWIQNKTYEGLSFERDYRSYFPLAVIRLKDHKQETIPVSRLEKSDHIQVRNDEIIPADSLLLSEEANIDYSFVTGESEPVYKQKGEFIYAGGRQQGPAIQLEIQKPTSQSYLTQLWNNEAFKKDEKSQLQSLVDKISKYFTAAILLIALSGLAIWLFIDPFKSWFVFTSVLIIACPCALSLSTPFTLGNTMNVFGRNHFYLKNTHVIEKLTRINHIVFDKTGTLTQNQKGRIRYSGQPMNAEEKKWLARIVSNSTHPLSRKILHEIGGELTDLKTKINSFEEIKGKGITGIVDGHLIKLGSKALLNGELKMEETTEDKPDFSQANVYLSIDSKLKGSFIVDNIYREGLTELISELRNNYSLSILSGDNETEKQTLIAMFPPGTEMKFRQQPEQKLDYINHLKEKGNYILMLGDGLNDAGALVMSDVGIAVTEDITSFTPASEAILGSTAIGKIDAFLNFSKIAKNIILTSFGISFLYNIVGMSFALLGMLTPIIAAVLMPLSSISVVIFATFAVHVMAKYKKLI